MINMSGWSSKWGHIEETLSAKGRRNSASKLFDRFRSGSLPGWIGGGSIEQPGCSSSTSQQSFQEQSPLSTTTEVPGPVPELCQETIQQIQTQMSASTNLPAGIAVRPKKPRSSRASSSSTDHSAASTARCGTIPSVMKVKRHINNDAPIRSHENEDVFHDRLFSQAKNGDILYASPLSIESTPLTPRKNQFTIVPCATEEAELEKSSKRRGNEGLGLIVSALYGKLLVVMGIAFPSSEVISSYIPPSFYDGFYLYLYFGSITFMICIYGNILRQKATRSMRCTLQRIHTMRAKITTNSSEMTTTAPEEISSESEGCVSGSAAEHHYTESANEINGQRIHFGSFYLRMGAVSFGIGSMIYSGLEFGQYFELDPDTKCHNFMIALTPSVRMIFTFMQMYFIFLNSKMAVYKLGLGAQFGLMHMIGTNLCVWLNVLVQETRHEILMFYNPDNGSIIYPSGNTNIYQGHSLKGHSHNPYSYLTTTSSTTASPTTTSSTTEGHDMNNSTVSTLMTVLEAHQRVRRGLKGPYSFVQCRRSDIMGSLVQNASPFLFPCTIEYSLICAAILYVMWKSMAASMKRNHHGHFHKGDLAMGLKRSPHHYSVDCARANKGLFVGIFVLVMTIISLILFFVLIQKPGYQAWAVLEVNITELVLYTMTTFAVLIGMCQMRELRYCRSRNLELDNILLIVSQTGSFIYNVFTIIGGHFTMKKNTALVLVTALSSLIQLLFQTLFILDASRRSAATSEQARRKPGREVVTFLLVTNLAMWSINTLEKSRADSHPVQLKFYGVWAWTIITHVSMPLAIFYRFHSTVCLCEIWKRAYKIKPPIYR